MLRPTYLSKGREKKIVKTGKGSGHLGLSPTALPTTSHAQQADVVNGVLDVRNKETELDE